VCEVYTERYGPTCASRPESPGSLSNRLISQLQMHHSKNLSDIASLRSTVSALNVLRPDLHRRESLSIGVCLSSALTSVQESMRVEVCECACVCARACARAYVCTCVCVCVFVRGVWRETAKKNGLVLPA